MLDYTVLYYLINQQNSSRKGTCLVKIRGGINYVYLNTVCPTRYRNRHFFNNVTTNEDIRRTTDTHYKHIPFHFSHNERTPVQISLQDPH